MATWAITRRVICAAIVPARFAKGTARNVDSSRSPMPNWLQSPQSEIMPSSSTGKMDTARASTRTNICDPYALVPSARVSNLTSLNLAFCHLLAQQTQVAKQVRRRSVLSHAWTATTLDLLMANFYSACVSRHGCVPDDFACARVAELADALDLGSSGQPWGFESPLSHQRT